MRRINIKIDDKIDTKSFLDLNVGSRLDWDGYRFSINSKRRVANQMYDGSTIGAKNDNN